MTVGNLSAALFVSTCSRCMTPGETAAKPLWFVKFGGSHWVIVLCKNCKEALNGSTDKAQEWVNSMIDTNGKCVLYTDELSRFKGTRAASRARRISRRSRNKEGWHDSQVHADS